jgi:NAD(P)H-dependent FMN reductase
MLTLQVIIASTRQGRQGVPVGTWTHTQAQTHGRFNVELIDLAAVNLPLFDEPRHPRFRQYEHQHTKDWSASVARADAFVIVTPEYDHAAPASLVNALQYLVQEWAYKPVAFVSYGGVSAGTRGVQMTKQICAALKMPTMLEAVAVPFFARHIDASTGVFDPGELQLQAAKVMLDELHRWAEALQILRITPEE